MADRPILPHGFALLSEFTMSWTRRLILSLVVACTPLLAHAETTKLDAILARGVVRVGVTGDYAPFALRDAAGVVKGLDIDMAENLAAALGVKLEIVPTKWADLLTDVAADKFDIGMGGISITLARQKAAFFSTTVMRTGKAAIARCDAKAKFQSLADIDKPGVKVITNPGGTNEKFDRATLKAAEIVVFPTNTGVWDELIAGHADLMITDNVETRLQQKQHPELCAINPDKPFDFGELGYLLPRDPVLEAYVDQWLHFASETGLLQTTIGKYLN
jgi:cyclohexadienyl dehydratase